MNRSGLIIRLIVLALVIVVVVWIARNTYWDTVKVPQPLKKEAATNPFYGAQRLVEKLGATSSWDRILRDVPPNAAIVVSSWHWDLGAGRRERMEKWVERRSPGARAQARRRGRGVRAWSGIARQLPSSKEDDEDDEDEEGDEEKTPSKPVVPRSNCRVLQDATPEGERTGTGPSRAFELCGAEDGSHLVTSRRTAWALEDGSGNQLLRVNVGKGSVTVINAMPFNVPFEYRAFLEGDHASLLVAAVQLRKKDDVHFMSEEEHPSMLALMWLFGWPVVLLALTLIALALWRSGVRFGPLVAQPEQARRSLAEQIRGTGLFVVRFGGGKALHAAAVRALNEAAVRRIGAYWRLSANERIEAIAKLTGADAGSLGPAVKTAARVARKSCGTRSCSSSPCGADY